MLSATVLKFADGLESTVLDEGSNGVKEYLETTMQVLQALQSLLFYDGQLREEFGASENLLRAVLEVYVSQWDLCARIDVSEGGGVVPLCGRGVFDPIQSKMSLYGPDIFNFTKFYTILKSLYLFNHLSSPPLPPLPPAPPPSMDKITL